MDEPAALSVGLRGKPVGTLVNPGGDRTLFAFLPEHLDDRDRPTLSLSFEDGLGGVNHDPAQVYDGRLMPFLSNLLPEGETRGWLAARAGIDPGREFLWLQALGGDLPGAVTARPAADRALLPRAARNSP